MSLETAVTTFFHALFFLIPLYAANGGALLIGTLFPTKPIDGNIRFWDNEPLFGKGKTWSGTFGGIVLAVLFGTAAWIIAGPHPFFSSLPIPYPLFCLVVGIGAIAGDIFGSFIKRRLLLSSGSASPVLDQLDFVAGAYLVATPFYLAGAEEVLFVCVFTLFTHTASNYLAYQVGLKKVPW